MRKRITGANVCDAYDLTLFDLFEAVENGLKAYDSLGREIASRDDVHRKMSELFYKAALKGVAGSKFEDYNNDTFESSPCPPPTNEDLLRYSEYIFKLSDIESVFGTIQKQKEDQTLSDSNDILNNESDIVDSIHINHSSVGNAQGQSEDVDVSTAQISSECRESSKQHRHKRKRLSDADCLKIYLNHYDGGQTRSELENNYDWPNSPFADYPKPETAKSRISEAIKRGRKQLLPHERSANDKAGQK